MNCDPIARYYAALEHLAFGCALERCRVRYLPEIAGARRVLALGDGDGRALVALLATCPQAQIDYVDASARMLARARRRTQNSPRVTYIQADALALPLPAHIYDAIVTHFFLDCFDDGNLSLLIERITRAAQPGVRWIVSEFRAGQWWSRWLVRGLYLFFRLTTGLQTRQLPNYAPLLAQAGFRCLQSAASVDGLLISEIWGAPDIRISKP